MSIDKKTHVLHPEILATTSGSSDTVVASTSETTVQPSRGYEPMKLNANCLRIIDGDLEFGKSVSLLVLATGEEIRGKVHSSICVPGGRHEVDIKTPDGKHLVIDYRNGESGKKKG